MTERATRPEWNATSEPLVKLLLHKKGLPQRDAVEVGKKMVRIVRGKDMKEFLSRDSNLSMLRKKFPLIFPASACGAATGASNSPGGTPAVPIAEQEICKIGQSLLEQGFFVRVLDQAFKTKQEDQAKKLAWPSRVSISSENTFDLKGYYMILYEDSNPLMRKMLLASLLAVTLFLCMFPAWPLYLKIGAWHVLVALSSSLLGITIVRMILFVLVWCIGADFWIFPNMNDEYLGLVDSFKPFYSFEWRKDEKLMLLSRFLAIGMIASGSYMLAQTHELKDVREFLETAYLDVVEWGVDKLTKTPDVKMLPKWEDIEKETRDLGSASHDYLGDDF
jgi:translocation protein SEC62